MITKENIPKIKEMVWALNESLKMIRDNTNFTPPELSKAIGSLLDAERYLRITIEKMDIQ